MKRTIEEIQRIVRDEWPKYRERKKVKIKRKKLTLYQEALKIFNK